MGILSQYVPRIVDIMQQTNFVLLLPQTNIMMTDDGIPCLADVGLHSRLSKIKYCDVWPFPFGWMLQAPEELSPQCDPSVFFSTKEMDVYAFASTVYMVSLYVYPLLLFMLTHRWQIFPSKPPLPVHPYGRGGIGIVHRG